MIFALIISLFSEAIYLYLGKYLPTVPEICPAIPGQLKFCFSQQQQKKLFCSTHVSDLTVGPAFSLFQNGNRIIK